MNEEECLPLLDVRFDRNCRVFDRRTTDGVGVIPSLIVEREETNRSVHFRCTTKRSVPNSFGSNARSDSRTNEWNVRFNVTREQSRLDVEIRIDLSSIVHHHLLGQPQRRGMTIVSNRHPSKIVTIRRMYSFMESHRARESSRHWPNLNLMMSDHWRRSRRQ